MAPRKLEEIQIGEMLGPIQLNISKDQNRRFALACGLNAPRFMDDEKARAEGLPGMIVPGNMSLALLTRVVTDWIGDSPASLTRISTTYRSPVLPERAVTVVGFATQVDREKRSVELDLWMENEDAERLVTATATVQFWREEDARSSSPL